MKTIKKNIAKKVPPWKKPVIQAIALLFIAGLLAYSNTFYGSFCWDDIVQIVKNENVHDLSSFADPSRWADVNYRPLSKFTLALNWFFGEEDVLGYHTINILLHILTAFVAYLLARYTLTLLAV